VLPPCVPEEVPLGAAELPDDPLWGV